MAGLIRLEVPVGGAFGRATQLVAASKKDSDSLASPDQAFADVAD